MLRILWPKSHPIDERCFFHFLFNFVTETVVSLYQFRTNTVTNSDTGTRSIDKKVDIYPHRWIFQYDSSFTSLREPWIISNWSKLSINNSQMTHETRITDRISGLIDLYRDGRTSYVTTIYKRYLLLLRVPRVAYIRLDRFSSSRLRKNSFIVDST